MNLHRMIIGRTILISPRNTHSYLIVQYLNSARCKIYLVGDGVLIVTIYYKASLTAIRKYTSTNGSSRREGR